MRVYFWNWTYMTTCTRWSTARKTPLIWGVEEEDAVSANNKPLPWWQWGACAASVNSSVFKYVPFDFCFRHFVKASVIFIYFSIYLSICLFFYLSIASTFIKKYNAQYTAVFALLSQKIYFFMWHFQALQLHYQTCAGWISASLSHHRDNCVYKNKNRTSIVVALTEWMDLQLVQWRTPTK